MMDMTNVFEKLGAAGAPMCARDADSGDLIRAVQIAIDAKSRCISVDAAAVPVVWPWLENTDIDIAARITPLADGDADTCMSDLAGRIKKVFKQGASTVQIFINRAELDAFADAVAPIRDDLFFNRKLSVALDLSECNGDWGAVFDALMRAGADSVLLTMTRDAGDRSDFVGRIYGLMQMRHPWRGALHFALGKNPARIEQVQRLATVMHKESLAGLLFFVNN